MFPDSVWCYALNPTPPPHSPPPTPQQESWAAAVPDEQILNYPRDEMLRPENRSFISVTGLLLKATSLSNAFCLIHGNTHIRYLTPITPLTAESLPVHQHDLRAEPHGAKGPANAIK